MKRRIRKDVWLIAGVALAVVLAMLAITYFRPQLAHAAEVVIRSNGTEIGRYPLNEDRSIPVHTEYGYNLVVIEHGLVYVKEADCHNQDCVSQGAMSLDNYTQRFLGNLILCLPHKLEISLVQQS